MIIEHQNCEFLNPVYWNSELEQFLPLNSEIDKFSSWNFKEMNCSTTIETSELIENASTGAEFFVDKTINYGDTIIIFFLILFAVFGIIKIIADFFIPRKMDFKR